MHNDFSRRQVATGALAALALALCGAATSPARAMDAAAQRIETYYKTLLPAVAGASGLGVAQRAQRITPAIFSAFDIAGMTRIAVGPAWSRFSEAERSATIEEIGRAHV